MKKIISIFLLGTVLFLCACEKATPTQQPKTENVLLTDQEKTGTEKAGKDSEILTDPDAGGASILTQKYRDRYYNITYPFVEFVGKDVYWAWYESLGENYDPGKENVMLMKSFLQHFNISRKEFDRCVIEDAKWISEADRPCMNPKDYADQELDELYNGDIIYTFDDEIINAYYLGIDYPYYDAAEFEEKTENNEPVYTTDWFTVEELEADFIAKYGSLD